MNILKYTVELSDTIKKVCVYDNDKLFFEIECLIVSPYTIEEEIQNWLDDNGFENENFEFNKIN